HAKEQAGARRRGGAQDFAVGRAQCGEVPLFERGKLGGFGEESRKVVRLRETAGVDVFADQQAVGRMKAAVAAKVTGAAFGKVGLNPLGQRVVVGRRGELGERIDDQRFFIQPAETRKLQSVIRLIEEEV